VLDPHWLSRAITHVLEDETTIASGGILDHNRLTEIWPSKAYPVNRHQFLLALMEKLDVSYSVRSQQGAVSLIAQFLPEASQKKLPWNLEDPLPTGEIKQLGIVCEMGQEVPGLIPWLIAETHAYQVDVDDLQMRGRTLAWSDGVCEIHPTHPKLSSRLSGAPSTVYICGYEDRRR
jgi:internalin A